MGMFDDLRVVDYPLPGGVVRDHFQTKSLLCALDQYEVRADGSLWHEDYDIEDRSDPNATGIARLRGLLTPVNKRWVRVDFTGRLEFHDWDKDTHEWFSFVAHMEDGKVRRIERVEQDPVADARRRGGR